MTLAELLPALHGIPRCEKLRAIQLLAADVAREDGEMLVPSEAAYPVWSPFDAFDGAASLMQLLEDEKAALVPRCRSVFPTLKSIRYWVRPVRCRMRRSPFNWVIEKCKYPG